MSTRFVSCWIIGALLLAGMFAPARGHDGNTPTTQIEKSLNQPISVDFTNMSLREIISELHALSGINIISDSNALEEEGISLDRRLTMKLSGVSLKSALNMLLGQVRLTYIIRDGVLTITTPVHARGKLVQKTYAVADLVIPVDYQPRPCTVVKPQSIPGPASSQLVDPAATRPRAPEGTIEETLIATIKNSIAPQTWSDRGGPGTMDYYPLGMALVVNQTADVHEQVAELLTSLRRLQDTEVSVDVRWMTVPGSSFERIAREMPKSLSVEMMKDAAHAEIASRPLPSCRPADCGKVAFLNDSQLRKILELAKADRSTHAMRAPKMTLFNGQTGTFNCTEQATFVTGLSESRQADGSTILTPRNESFTIGLQMCLQPVVSADRRFVRVNLKLNNTELATSPVPLHPVTTFIKSERAAEPIPCVNFIQQPLFSRVSIDRTVAVPEGNTVVFAGWKKPKTVRSDDSWSNLGFIPYLGLLFSWEEEPPKPETVLVMVTPHIISHEQEEIRQTGYIRPQPEMRPPARCAAAVPPAKLAVALAAEESEPPPSTKQSSGNDRKLAKVMEQYHRACREGRQDDARKLALEALVIDPTCFGKDREQAFNFWVGYFH